MNRPVVLFLCTNNAARSQIAEALLKSKAADHFDVHSAGTEPSENVHPLTIQVMREVGIDLTGCRPKGFYEYLGRLSVRVAIFVCPKSEDKCPTVGRVRWCVWSGRSRTRQSFEDPSKSVWQGSDPSGTRSTRRSPCG